MSDTLSRLRLPLILEAPFETIDYQLFLTSMVPVLGD
jgi:hypothetical protein